MTKMDNNFFNLIDQEEDLKDIKKYLHIPFEHLNKMKITIGALNCHEHTEDILNECDFIKENLIKLINQYLKLSIKERNTNFFPNSELTHKEFLIDYLKNSCYQIYELEQELFADFPDEFDFVENWPSLISFQNEYCYEDNSIHKNLSIENLPKIESKNSIHIKDFYFGFLFLIPAFIWFLIIPYLDDLSNKNNENKILHIEQDRPYKNLIYIYSAIKLNKNEQNNFYSLIKNSYFRIPEGFTLIDKNSLADYYQKNYYEYKINENNVSSISVDNLTFFQCKYIVTKIIYLEEDIRINNKNILSQSDFCLKSHSNSIVIFIKSIENK